MKQGIFIVCFMSIWFISLSLPAQTMSRKVINTSGDIMSNDQISLSISLGQAGLIGSLEEDVLTLHIGFQQMETLKSTSLFSLAEGCEIETYPNPFQREFNLLVEADYPGVMYCRIFDSFGKTRYKLEGILTPGGIGYFTLAPNELLSGVYFLEIKIKTKTGQANRVCFPIIKD